MFRDVGRIPPARLTNSLQIVYYRLHLSLHLSDDFQIYLFTAVCLVLLLPSAVDFIY